MRIKVSVSTGLGGSRREEVIEIPDEELKELSKEEKEAYLERYAQEWLWNHIDFSWSEVQ